MAGADGAAGAPAAGRGRDRGGKAGLYDLQPTVSKYITYIGGAGKESLTQERTKLTKANGRRRSWRTSCSRGEVHRTEDIERGIKTMFLNIRSRFLALPAKLSPTLATLGDDQTAIFDELKGAIDEILEEMSDPRAAFAVQDGEADGEETE